MNERDLRQELEDDLQRAPRQRVFYMEGPTDVPIFFSLLGVSRPADDVHDGILVRGLSKKSGMGGSSVRQRVELAQRRGYPGIFGIIDGDGRALASLAREFDDPYAGPLFSWKGYCIENLLVRAGWPADWGVEPDWPKVLLDHVPYVALNQLYRELQGRLKTLGLDRYRRPVLQNPLHTAAEVEAALAKDKGLIADLDVAALFRQFVAQLQAAMAGNLDEGHARVDGKWLVDVWAPAQIGASPERCREAWQEAVRLSGGLKDVRDFWQRLLR